MVQALTLLHALHKGKFVVTKGLLAQGISPAEHFRLELVHAYLLVARRRPG